MAYPADPAPQIKAATVQVTVFQQNCTLVWEAASRVAMGVDPGGEPGRIHEAIGRFGLDVQFLLLTHGHLDHAGGATALKGILDAERAAAGGEPLPLLGPDRPDQLLLDGIEEAQRAYGLSGLRNATPDRYLAEGESVALGPFTFEVLHCPGHTPGHLVYVERAARFALVGDVIFQGSVGRTDLPYGDHAALIEAIRTKLLPLGDDIRFLCGHGSGSSFGVERRTNPFLQE